MSDHDSLVDWLRGAAKDMRGAGQHFPAMQMVEAADTICRLQAEVLSLQMKKSGTLTLPR